MKHIIQLLLLATLVVSCENNGFLDRFPKDAFTEPTFFQTENDLKYYANQLYGDLPVQFMDYDNNSDNMVPRSINGFLAGTYTVPSTKGGWGIDDWKKIRVCNFFLDHYSRAETPAKEKYAGEIRFFRALFYWQKVVRFGDVPLMLKSLDDTSNELYGPRDNHKTVMDEVLKDLDFAIANLPEQKDAEAGRLHKDAARALKSRICLWEGTFRKYHDLGDEQPFLQACVQASEEIMNGNNYSIYTTGNKEEDYRNLFIQRDLSGNPEAIFFRAYILDINTHGYTRTAGGNSTGLSKDFVENYLFTDGKPIGLTALPYDDTTPAKECEGRDPRYKQTIATPGFVWTIGENGQPDLVFTLPEIGRPQTSTGYWLIKGRSSDYIQHAADRSDLDAFIFRYAEVLLNYAEAKYELTGTLTQAELDKSINQLRDRVGMPFLTSSPAADPHAATYYGYSVSPLLYEIRRERRVELVGEGFRFNDILRWKAGKLIENMKTIRGMKLTQELRAQYGDLDVVNSIEVDADNYIIVYPSLPDGRKWNDKMYLYPLPTDQVTYYGDKNNPGWD